MKPNLSRTRNNEINDLIEKLTRLLTSIDKDNFKYRIITGTTDSTANTQRLFKHGMSPRPWVVLPIRGNIYINYIDNDNVDIRSTQTSITFEAIALG